MFAVRQAAVANLVQLAAAFGPAWAAASLYPRVLALGAAPAAPHTLRLTVLLAAAALAPAAGPDAVARQFVPVVCSLKNDKVANVRCVWAGPPTCRS